MTAVGLMQIQCLGPGCAQPVAVSAAYANALNWLTDALKLSHLQVPAQLSSSESQSQRRKWWLEMIDQCTACKHAISFGLMSEFSSSAPTTAASITSGWLARMRHNRKKFVQAWP